MAMSFEFISGSADNKKSIFRILQSSEKGRRVLDSLSLPESIEEREVYEKNKEYIDRLYQILATIDSERKLERSRRLKK